MPRVQPLRATHSEPSLSPGEGELPPVLRAPAGGRTGLQGQRDPEAAEGCTAAEALPAGAGGGLSQPDRRPGATASGQVRGHRGRSQGGRGGGGLGARGQLH